MKYDILHEQYKKTWRREERQIKNCVFSIAKINTI
jgi:hypothetical protein